jgi:RNA polymerase sigma-70 factor (ECF subfamily)
MRPTAFTDAEILRAAASDPAAFADFYRRYERPILAYFRRQTGHSELAADLAAEVFAEALLACKRYRPARAPAGAWLFGIAHHKLAKSRRRGVVEDRARRRLGVPPLALLDDALARVDELSDECATRFLDDLPEDQRLAIEARIVQERSYDEIAGELRCSPAVVRKRVSRGLTTLKHRLEEVPS